jgi:hypothetical protein
MLIYKPDSLASFGNKEGIMPECHDYVEYAFHTIRVINTEQWRQEGIEAFTQRWGGVDLSTFVRVLHQTEGED